jgi:riboflavin biosynthesis pyrimidine reductase
MMAGMPPAHRSGPLTPEQVQGWYAGPEGEPWVRGMFIGSLDGRATGPRGRSGELNHGSAGDHAVFDGLRTWADAVVVGAGTIRTEGYGPLALTPEQVALRRRADPGGDRAAHPTLVVVTRTGDLPEELREVRGGPAHGEVIVLGGDGQDVDPARVLAACHERGLTRVVHEGGPGLFWPWVAAGLVDELCLTVRPVLVGGEAPLLTPTGVRLPGPTGTATHTLSWDGDLLVRLALR